VLIPAGVMVPADTSVYAAEVWRRGLRDLHRDGIDLPAPMLELLDELEVTARRVTANVTAVTSETTPSATIDPMGREVGTAAAARILGLKSHRSVAARCRRGSLLHRMVNGKYLIRAEYLEEIA
jgi:hypothetical protein